MLPRHIGNDYYKIKPLSYKVQKRTSGGGFKQYTSLHGITSMYGNAKERFIIYRPKYKAVYLTLNSHPLEHDKYLNNLSYS